MDDFAPDPFKNYVMKGASVVSTTIEPNGITEAELQTMEGMTKEQLITLIKRCNAEQIRIGLLTDDEAYEAACLKLLHGGLTEKDIWKALPSLKEWMDRRKGKPAQSIAMTIENKGITALSDEKLLRLEKELARITGSDAIIIAPEPQKLVT